MRILLLCLAGMSWSFDACNTTEPELPVPPVDTTSHDFTWTVETLGEVGSSVLYDVAIIDDSLAYAVGAVYLRDSLGNWDPDAYNLLKWSGTSWKLLRVQFYTFCGQSSTGSYPARAIVALSPQDVWIAMDGSQVVVWDGQRQSASMCTPISVNKLWGKDRNSIYGVGNGGGIARYSNGAWQKLESGTTIDLRDVYGSSTGGTVWASGYSNDYFNSVLLAFDGQSWNTIWARPPGTPSSFGDLAMTLTVVGSTLYSATNLGVFSQASSTMSLAPTKMLDLDAAPFRIRGSAPNNLFVVGDQAKIWHYNGSTWKQLNVPDPNRPLYSVAASKNTVIAVGPDYNTFPRRAVVYVGRR
ncbi:MAG: glucosyl transferase [Bacteroidota bacterium]